MSAQLSTMFGSWWTTPELQGLNRLPARTSIPTDETETATSLDGMWEFALALDPASAGKGEHGPFTTVAVPGCWTMQDLGPAGVDQPHYTNVVMPFDGDPPQVPVHNPTGIYRRSFTGPADWSERDVILHVGGAESAAAIWCNDGFVGLMTDSRLPSEFDLTGHLQPGENTLTIVVPRWTSHTWIEDQDHWHHGGLHRSIHLRSISRIAHLADVIITTDYNLATNAGTAIIEARVGGNHHGCAVTVTIDEASGGATGRGEAVSATEPVAVFDTSSHMAQMDHTYTYPGPLASVTLEANQVRPWSHEDPHLHTATITLTGPDGHELAVETHRIGFNRVEIRGAELLLNGVAVPISGVNRHDHHPDTGKTLTPAELVADIEQIKAAGLNAVRTAHYPPDPVLLDACDRIGLWVVCEANLESHARWTEVSHDPRYQGAFVERVQRMVATHRNHPSIMGWSLGNESGHGPAHDAAAAWVRHADPSRFVQYEGAVRNPWLADPATANRSAATDVICPMYPTVEQIITWARKSRLDAPMIMCEYSHAMGNSNGDLGRYWDAIDRFHGLQGGFIWDWKDQGLRLADGDLGYGGHFGDKPNDGDFCCNGLVGAEGDPHPAIEELRYLTRPIVTGYDADAGHLIVTNRRSFTALDDVEATAEVTADGVVVWSATGLTAEAGPGETTTVAIDAPAADTLGPGEVFLTVRWFTAGTRSDDVIPLAWDQHLLRPAGSAPSAVRAEEQAPRIRLVTNGEPSGLVDAATGETLIERWPTVSLWRAPTDNDGVTVGPVANRIGAVARWRDLELDGAPGESVADTLDRLGVVHTRTIDGVDDDGTATIVTVTETIDVPDDLHDLPRIGVVMALPARFDQLAWYGPGPWETYPDRSHAPVGVHRSSVADQYVPYARPQHHGSHVNTRWLELSSSTDAGRAPRLRFQLAADEGGKTGETRGLIFDVSRYRPADLERALTPGRLSPAEPDLIHLHLDVGLRGVGTAACGPDTSHRTRAGRHRFTWSVRLIDR